VAVQCLALVKGKEIRAQGSVNGAPRLLRHQQLHVAAQHVGFAAAHPYDAAQPCGEGVGQGAEDEVLDKQFNRDGVLLQVLVVQASVNDHVPQAGARLPACLGEPEAGLDDDSGTVFGVHGGGRIFGSSNRNSVFLKDKK
jgi:hypothetical protein